MVILATPVRFWVEFPDPSRSDDAVIYRCDLTWLTSRWRCLFAKGCPGIVADRPDDGCCTYGAHFSDADDRDRVAAAVRQLSEQDWQYRPRDYDERADSVLAWLVSEPTGEPLAAGLAEPGASDLGAARCDTGQDAVQPSDCMQQQGQCGYVNAQPDADLDDLPSPGQTALVDGACIFLNRPDFPGGAGCALHNLAARTGQAIIATKPEVCWQLPIRRSYERSTAPDAISRQVVRIGEFDRSSWGPGGHELAWYCTRDPLAHTATEPLYLSARSELVELMGEPAYEKLAQLAALFVSGRAAQLGVALPDTADIVSAGSSGAGARPGFR